MERDFVYPGTFGKKPSMGRSRWLIGAAILLVIVIVIFLIYRNRTTPSAVAGFNDGDMVTKTSKVSSDGCARGAFTRLISPNGLYELTSERDRGDISLYKADYRIWSSKSGKTQTDACLAIVQSNGNLVIYTRDGEEIWSTGTAGRGSGPYTLSVNDDSTITLTDSLSSVIWTSGITLYPSSLSTIASAAGGQIQILNSEDGRYVLMQQTDGNLVLTKTDTNTVVWASKSTSVGAEGGVSCWLQCDGNLVTYHKNGTVPWWSSGSTGKGAGGPYSLVVHRFGYVTIEDKNGMYVWQSNSNGMVYSDDQGGKFNFLNSADGKYFANVTARGEFVIYPGSDPSKPIWQQALEPSTVAGGYFGVVQGDGNLVVYRAATKVPVWSSRTNPSAGRIRLTLTNSGKLILENIGIGTNTFLWSNIASDTAPSSGTSAVMSSGPGGLRYLESKSGEYRTTIEPDANTLISVTRTATSTKMYGLPTTPGMSPYSMFIENGFMVIRNNANLMVWTNNPISGSTAGAFGRILVTPRLVPGAPVAPGMPGLDTPILGTGPWRLSMQDDGNFVEYDSTGLAVWATSSAPMQPISKSETIIMMRADGVSGAYSCASVVIPITALMSANGPQPWSNNIDNITCPTSPGELPLKWGAYWCFGKVKMPVGVKGTFGQNINGDLSSGLVETVIGTGDLDTSFWHADNTKRFGYFKFELLPGYYVA
jgi:hypothetical protein